MAGDRRLPVDSSHLALRFYRSGGWTRTLLEGYLLQGAIGDTALSHGDPPERAYFYLDHTQGSRLDIDRLYRERVGKVGRYYDGAPRETDIEYLRSMNN